MKLKYLKVICAFVMALSMLPAATELFAEHNNYCHRPNREDICEPEPKPECPVEDEPVYEPEPEPDCPVVDEPVCDPEPEPEPEPQPEPAPPVIEEDTIIDNTEINNEVNNNNTTDVNVENNNVNQNNNNIEFNPNINVTVEQQQQQKLETLKKENPAQYLREKSKQITQKEAVIVVKDNTSTKKQATPQNNIPAHVDPVDYANGKGPLDEDYVENPNTGELDTILYAGVLGGGGCVGLGALLLARRFML